MKYFISLIISIVLFSCSQRNSIVYRKPVKGYVYSEKNIPLKDVFIKYDSLDILSPTNIKTDKRGLFVLPKVTVKNDLEAKRRISKLSPLIYITKEGYENVIVDLKSYKKNEKDTVFIDIIKLKKNK